MKLKASLNACAENKCIQRDNSFGVTWCIVCGKIFNKPCFKRLQQDETRTFK